MDEKDIDLTVEDHEMTISANLNAERQDDRNCYSERRCGHVSRTFSLEGIDESHIIASHKNGILYVTLPKLNPQEKTNARRIRINANCGQCEHPDEIQ